MAENDNAVLTAAVGYVYTAPVGTAAPTPAQLNGLTLNNPASWAVSGWTSVGHTSRGSLPEFGFDGGSSEVKGSWQKKKLREITTEDPVDYVTVTLHQFDEQALELYYGPNASSTPGVFAVTTGQVNEKALLIVIEDGDVRLGHHAFKASVKRDDAIDLPIDDFASFPVRFTYLDYLTNPPFTWIASELFNVTSALPKLRLGGATGGTYTLKVNGVDTASLAYNANAAAIKAALVAVDDGISASQVTVTASGSDFDIDIPAALAVGTNSTTGGTGVTIV